MDFDADDYFKEEEARKAEIAKRRAEGAAEAFRDGVVQHAENIGDVFNDAGESLQRIGRGTDPESCKLFGCTGRFIDEVLGDNQVGQHRQPIVGAWNSYDFFGAATSPTFVGPGYALNLAQGFLGVSPNEKGELPTHGVLPDLVGAIRAPGKIAGMFAANPPDEHDATSHGLPPQSSGPRTSSSKSFGKGRMA